MFARSEWLIIEFLVLGALIYELVSIRGLIRKDREKPRDKT